MPDEHYPSDDYQPGVPDLSGLDYAVDMMRNAPSRDAMPDSSARLEIARLQEALRQAEIVNGGLRVTLDKVKTRYEHMQKTNEDLIGRNQRLKAKLDSYSHLLVPVGYRCSFEDMPESWLFCLGGVASERREPGIAYQTIYVKLEK